MLLQSLTALCNAPGGAGSIWKYLEALVRATGVSGRLAYISKMYFSLWKTPVVSERIWSANLEASISGEYQTLGGYSGRPSE